MFKIFLLFLPLFTFAQEWRVEEGAWITPSNLNIGINNSLQVGDSLGSDTLYVIGKVFADSIFANEKEYYGEMGFGDSSRLISLTQNTPTWVTNSGNTLWSTAALQLDGVAYSNDSLIITKAGIYQLTIQLSMDGLNGALIQLYAYKNGVQDCFCVGQQSLTSNRIFSLTYLDFTDANANDVFRVFIENTASNTDVNVLSGKMTITKIN